MFNCKLFFNTNTICSVKAFVSVLLFFFFTNTAEFKHVLSKLETGKYNLLFYPWYCLHECEWPYTIYMYVSVCVWERERDSETQRQRHAEKHREKNFFKIPWKVLGFNTETH